MTPGRWARFATPDGRVGVGAFEDGRITEHSGDLHRGSSPTGRILTDGEYRLLAPCTPSKIIALWNNFRALAEKLQKQPPAHPLYLLKPASCLAGPGDEIERPAAYPGKIAYEGELGIVIGRRCRRVGVGEAPEYILGYTCVNDVTAAEVLNETPDFAQWTRSKGYDTFGCLGPVIATGFDWRGAEVVTRVAGVERQRYPLADMIFPPAELVSALSHDMTLQPGDVIACGTSLGVGSIRDGAVVEVCIDGIGTLVNTLAAATGPA